METTEKECSSCNKIKKLDDFYKSANGLHGRYSKCKECRSASDKKYKDDIKIEKSKKIGGKKVKTSDSSQVDKKLSKYKTLSNDICIDLSDENLHEDEINESEFDIINTNLVAEEEDDIKNSTLSPGMNSLHNMTDDERRTKYFNKLKTIVEQTGGSCLGKLDDYITAHSKLLIKCKQGHEWEATLNNLNLGKWCPKCKINIGELIALASCNHLFDKEFIKIKPNWLKNNEGNKLELDMYNEELKLAVEYNGIQHYQFISYYHKTEEIFKKKCLDDKIKIQKCQEKGINLIVVPYAISLTNICEYIYIQKRSN